MEYYETIRALKHYLWVILAVTLVSLITTWLVSNFLLQPVFKSEATILIKGQIQQRDLSVSEVLLDEKYIKAFYNVAKSDTVAQSTLDELRLGWSLKYFRKIINMKMDFESGVLKVSSTTSEPERSLILIQTFLKNLEAHTSNNIMSMSIDIIDAPRLPKNPNGPNILVNLGLSLIGGLMTGVLISILLGRRENTTFRIPELERLNDIFCLGYLPRIRSEKKKLKLPKSNIFSINAHTTSTVNTVRTNLEYKLEKESVKTILITSPRPGEGKTTISVALACSLKEQGWNILMIDCNLRRPGLYKYCKEHEVLTDFDISSYYRARPIWVKTIKGLKLDMVMDHMVPGDRRHINFSFLRSMFKELENQFDLIIVDGPPLLSDGDTLKLSRISDGVVLVTCYEHLSCSILEESIRRLNQIQSKLLGIVINRVPDHKI